MKKRLFIGCSNGTGKHMAFKHVLDPHSRPVIEEPAYTKLSSDVEWFNLSKGGAGNSYIRWQLFNFLQKEKPDYVYLQFSGLVRRDFYFDIDNKESFDLKSNDIALSDKHIYMVGGNYKVIKNPQQFPDILKNFSYNYWDDNTNNWHSLQEIFCAISVLEKLDIKHNWTVYYDPINPPNKQTELEGKIEKWPEFINLANKLPSPLNYAIESGEKIDDGVHFGYDIFRSYIEDNISRINLEYMNEEKHNENRNTK